MHRFFITGLPRSRTAWMAAFMTAGNAVCLHEPRNWKAMWESDGAKFVGISDSGLGFQMQSIIDAYEPRILIIDRPIEEVEASLAALNTGLPRTNFCEILHKNLSKFNTGESNILRVPYHLLNDELTMQKIFWHLTPGECFDEGRFRAMRDVNIQADIQAALNYPATHYLTPKIEVIQ